MGAGREWQGERIYAAFWSARHWPNVLGLLVLVIVTSAVSLVTLEWGMCGAGVLFVPWIVVAFVAWGLLRRLRTPVLLLGESHIGVCALPDRGGGDGILGRRFRKPGREGMRMLALKEITDWSANGADIMLVHGMGGTVRFTLDGLRQEDRRRVRDYLASRLGR
jgi:hypothetical protein